MIGTGGGGRVELGVVIAADVLGGTDGDTMVGGAVPDPIAAKNACLLRITVQTSDGRTIVVKNLMPKAAADNGIEEFTIIQNLING